MNSDKQQVTEFEQFRALGAAVFALAFALLFAVLAGTLPPVDPSVMITGAVAALVACAFLFISIALTQSELAKSLALAPVRNYARKDIQQINDPLLI